MKTILKIRLSKSFALIVMCLTCFFANAQDEDPNFWSKVRFGGAVGAGFGSGYTNVSLSPMAIYEFNDYLGLGLGLQGSYIKDKGTDADLSSWLYGGSVIAIVNPLQQIQLSAELEQLRANVSVDSHFNGDFKDNFWNTALFLGAGYRTDSVIVGVRYNVLFDDDDFVYSTAWMPFVRLYF